MHKDGGGRNVILNEGQCDGHVIGRHNVIDKEYYIRRNEETAKSLYGDKINANRKVEGTSIWFDVFWRIHTK